VHITGLCLNTCSLHTLTLLTDQCIIQTDRDHDPILLNVWNAISRVSLRHIILMRLWGAKETQRDVY